MSISSDNPLRDGLRSRQVAEACSLVIFGATGDLTHRKLVPALYNLAAGGDLPPGLQMLGFARRDKTDESWREELEESNRKNSRGGHDDAIWENFAANIGYHRGNFNETEAYHSLAERLDKIDEEGGTRHNRLFYLSTAPEFFPVVLENLKAAGLNEPKGGGWARVIVEKPFGRDAASSAELSNHLASLFKEEEIYRIDHYLGKEMVQNLMTLRSVKGAR